MNPSLSYPEVFRRLSETNDRGSIAGEYAGLIRTHDDDEEDLRSTGTETPIRPDAFLLSDDAKIDLIEHHFGKIMNILGLDLNDDSLQGTPRRVAKMYVKEAFQGLDPANKPKPTLFENKYGYDHMLVERNITLFTYCEHHFVPIFGKVHVGYYSSGKVIGLSKINRIVHYFSKRPQVQERLTVQIANELRDVLQTEDVAVMIDAAHLCVSSRGIGDVNSSTVTSSFHGRFDDHSARAEFLTYVERK